MSEFPSVDASGFSADGRWFHQEGLWYYWDDSSQQYLLYQEQPPSPSPAASATSAAASSSAAAAKPAPKRKNTRIDPRNVPRPLTELQKASDKDAAGAQPIPVFHSRSGAVPPSPAIEFSVVDEGNCSPKYMRATLCQIPDRKEVLEESRLPLGLILQPFAGVNYDEPVQEVCCAKEDEGPIRCSRCGAYMNPFNFFEDEGRSFKCALCQRSNDVPRHYLCNLDENGLRRDRLERPELHRGSVDFVLPSLSDRTTFEPSFIFLLDVSYNAVISGLLQAGVSSIKGAIAHIFEFVPNARVGVISYDSKIHFYTVKAGSADVKIQVMADVENAFLPLPPKEVLIPLSNSESMTMLDVILTRILQLYIHNSNSSIAFGAAISVAVDALLSSGGKIFSTVSGIPSVGQGSLEDREDSKVIGTATESRLFNPQDSFYPILATRMAESAISLDLFIGANSYVDVASIGSLCKTSGGQVYFYSGFHISKNGFSLEADFYRAVSRESIFDGIMVLRTSAGLKVVEQFGNFFRRNAGEMDLPTCDSDKTFAVKIGFESKLSTETPAVFQNAVLYTNIRGERRIRVHTLSLPVVNSTSQVFKHADVDSVVNFSLRNVINHVSNSTISDCRKILRENCTEILYTYRKHCAQQTSSGHLILPEALKLLPLYTIGIMKNPILADYTDSDERNFLFGYANTMPLSVAISFCSPRLYALHRLPPESCVYREDGYFQYPPLQIVSAEFLDEAGIYLLDNGLVLSVWVGPEADPSQVREIFGLEDDISLEQMDFYQLQVVPDNSDASALSSKVYTLMETLRYYRPIYNPTVVITRSNLQESLDVQKFMNSLVEDAVELAKGEKPIGPEADRMSYVDFLCYLHRKIQDRFL